MPKRRNEAQLESLALFVATGGRPAAWAAQHNVKERTARSWAALPAFKARVRAHRAVITDRILGKHFRLAERAVRNIAKMMQSGNESIKYAANHNVFADLTTLSNLADFDQRITALEQALRADSHQPDRPPQGA